MRAPRLFVLAAASVLATDSVAAFDGFGQVVDAPGSVTVTIQSLSEIDDDLSYPVQNAGSWNVALTVEGAMEGSSRPTSCASSGRSRTRVARRSRSRSSSRPTTFSEEVDRFRSRSVPRMLRAESTT